MKRGKDFLSITDVTSKEIWDLFTLANKLKEELKTKEAENRLHVQKALLLLLLGKV